jgi:hypothetical protein
MTGLTPAEVEQVNADIDAKMAKLPPPGPETITEVAALLAAPRLRRAREDAARKAGLPLGERDDAARAAP